mmetsp:Transcript_13577/g.30114  ORF Transcript_13577/g.30114 Transcript_13577/m.30114 type:complete len:625 (+) Transcript_13577:238-2112(+)
MTQYAEILYTTLALNFVAIAHRCKWYHRLAIFMQGGHRTRELREPRRQEEEDRIHVRADAQSCPDTDPMAENGAPNDKSHAVSPTSSNPEHDMAQRHKLLLYWTYLPVYLLATCADWLQGPYKYAVYSAYGYDQHDISILFVAGFGSGMSLGSVVGGLADGWGRKRMALVYCACYTLSCLAKHFRPFWVLLLGRVLGGIATSLLFSVFDAWLIRAHAIRRIDKSYLSDSFSAANFGSSVVAILAGLVANAVVGTTADGGIKSNLLPAFQKAARIWTVQEAEESKHGGDSLGPPSTKDDKRWKAAWVYVGGGIAAFDLALIPLALCFLLALAVWDENYGEEHVGSSDGSEKTIETGSEALGTNRMGKNKHVGMFSALRGASITVWRSSVLLNLCAVSSFFEGAMYVFILLWTPALRALDKHPEEQGYAGPPLGIVFATFMVCCMLGTSVFAILTSMGVRPSLLLVSVLMLSAASCLIIAQTSNDTMSYTAMLLFEACIGAYYPAMSTLKGSVVPEDQRAAIYSVFRLPLNLVVLLNLFSNLRFEQSFGVCAVMLALSIVLQLRVVAWEGGISHAVWRSKEPRLILKRKDSTVVDGNVTREISEKHHPNNSEGGVKRRHSFSLEKV